MEANDEEAEANDEEAEATEEEPLLAQGVHHDEQPPRSCACGATCTRRAVRLARAADSLLFIYHLCYLE
jgi:hypothetical protein